MNEKIKNALGIAISIAVLVFGYALISFVSTYSRSIEPSSFRSFSVTGEGKVTAIPDIAQFTFRVIGEGGKDLDALLKENTEKMNRAIEFVKGKGVEAKDIKTQSYNVEPRYQYYSCPSDRPAPCPPPEIVGYTVTQTVSVKVRDFSKVGEILSGIIQNGANSVSQLSFTIDDPTKVENEARSEAIEKAKEKARAMAQAGGFRIGRLLSISEGGFSPPPYPSFYEEKALSGGATVPSVQPTIEPGSQEVTAKVTLTYEIE